VDIKKGDIVRIFEPTGKRIEVDGQFTFVATSDSYFNSELGVYQFDFDFIKH